MKKVLIGAMVILSLGVVGCNSKDTNTVNVMAVNKAEKVVKSEYISRLTRIGESTISNHEEGNEYDRKDSTSEVSDVQTYKPDRDRYKDYVENISTFRTEDEQINKLHDKLIETSLDVYNMSDEIVAIILESERIMDTNKKSDITEKEEKKVMEIIEKKDILRTQIYNQKEHVENILTELGNVLGVS